MDKDDLSWLRSYKIHQENLLYSRINIFLVVQAIFVAIAGSAAVDQICWLTMLSALLGFTLAIIWRLAVSRQSEIVENCRSWLRGEDKMFRSWQDRRNVRDQQKFRNLRISGQSLLIVFLPWLFISFWLGSSLVAVKIVEVCHCIQY